MSDECLIDGGSNPSAGDKKAQIVPDSPGAVGNTPTTAPKQVPTRKQHFFTYFPLSKEEIVPIVLTLKKFATKGIIQSETCPSTGLYHLHGVIQCPKRHRDTEFGLTKEIHWEAVKQISKAEAYCRKGRNDYPDNTKAKDWTEGDFNGDYAVEWGYTILKLIKPDRPYQQDIIKIVEGEPDDRKIYWFYERIGNVGKSSLTKYLCVKHNALFIAEGKRSDLVNLVFNCDMEKTRTIVLDVPRANKNNVSYKAIEEIKNGLICNTKYETGMKAFNPPHIIIFSNYPPDLSGVSKDRWEIYEIQEDYTSLKCDSVEDV